MKTRHFSGPVAELEVDALVFVGFEEAGPAIQDERIADLYSSGEFSGKALESAILHKPAGFKAKRLVLAGGGKPDKFTPAEMRKLAGGILRVLKPKGARTIAFALDGSYKGDDFASAAVEGAILGDFEPDQYKTDPKKNEKQVDEVVIVGGTEAAVERGRILAESQNYSRTLANDPPNILTPSLLADRARQLAYEGLEVEVLDQDRMRQLGMGALLGVAQGSAEPPALIIVRYVPAEGSTSRDHLGLVGKGVTFDTGGISIKPAEGMEKMKYDMAGGAAVLGRHASHRATEALHSSDRAGAGCREYAGKQSAASGRHRDRSFRQDHRSSQYGCRRPFDPRGRDDLRRATWLHAFGGRRDAHRRRRGCARYGEHRCVQQQRSVS